MVVLLVATEGGGAALGIFTSVVTAGPLPIGEEPWMVDTLEEHILPAA